MHEGDETVVDEGVQRLLELDQQGEVALRRDLAGKHPKHCVQNYGLNAAPELQLRVCTELVKSGVLRTGQMSLPTAVMV